MDHHYEKKLRYNRLRKALVLTGILILFSAAGMFVQTYFRVSTIYVDGNIHYTDEEISQIVTSGTLGNNTIYLFFKYRNKDIDNIPFVESMSVSIESAQAIRVKVYEKSLAGYVEYLEKYMYFDKDGYIVECTDEKTEGIPQVTGLKFDHVLLYEKLPVDNDEIFKKILTVTQIINKYQLTADKIHFDDSYQLTVSFGDVRVFMGDDAFIDEKMMVLPYILPKLEGKSGMIDMQSYEKGDLISFQPD